LCNMGTVLVLHKQNKMQHKNRPHIAPILHQTKGMVIIMKKNGILHVELMKELTALRHGDQIAILDAGMPIPQGCKVIDLALVRGIPSFVDTIKAVLNEIVIEKFIFFAPMETYNPEMFQNICTMMSKQQQEGLPNPEFGEKIKTSKVVVRTAEFGSCCNIILVSASGLQKYVDQYDVTFA